MAALGAGFMILGILNSFAGNEGLTAGLTVVGGLFMLTPMTIIALRIMEIEEQIEDLREKKQ